MTAHAICIMMHMCKYIKTWVCHIHNSGFFFIMILARQKRPIKKRKKNIFYLILNALLYYDLVLSL